MDAVRRMGKDVYLNTSEMVGVKRKKPFTKRKEIHKIFQIIFEKRLTTVQF